MKKKPLSETHPHLKEFSIFLEKLHTESDRGMVLNSTGYLEEQLKNVLLSFFVEDASITALVEGGSAPIGTFSARITTCFALGLLNKLEHDDLHQLRRIRNDFAHSIYTSFETQSVKDRCKTLHFKAHDYSTEDKGDIVVSPSGQFQTAATGLILNFVNRPHYVAKHRRVPTVWPY